MRRVKLPFEDPAGVFRADFGKGADFDDIFEPRPQAAFAGENPAVGEFVLELRFGRFERRLTDHAPLEELQMLIGNRGGLGR